MPIHIWASYLNHLNFYSISFVTFSYKISLTSLIWKVLIKIFLDKFVLILSITQSIIFNCSVIVKHFKSIIIVDCY